VISGSGTGLTKTGTGALTLSATNTYSGTTTVSAGTLTVSGSISSSAVSLNGGTLNGTGTTGAVTSTASGGTVAPGAPPPGILSSGSVNLSSGSPTYSVALNGTTAGTSYSQLNVAGTVNLTGATLSASLGYTPVNGDSYTIINNDGTDPVTGTFAGLPEGTGLVIGGYSFRISYVGGTGNDVVLTAGGATKLAITSVPPTATANVNFSVTVQSQDANGNCVQVNSNTGILLASDGAGTLSGNTATIAAGTCSVTLNSVQDDQGETIHLTASRTSGDSLTTSAASSAIVVANGTFTTNTAVAINGTPKVGVATTLTPGSYTPSHTGTSYQWQLCDSGGGSCMNISGATGSTYTPVAGDVGGTLTVIETITRAGYNNGGSTSAASPLVINGDFTLTSDVVIDGVPTVGTTLTITNSVYAPTVTTRTQQWQLCDSGGGSCNDISGETGKTYTPVYSDVGMTLRVVQTVSRAGYNDAVSTSAASAVVINGDFTTTTAVSINGTPTVGTATTLTAGSYSPTPLSVAYQWTLCDSAGNNCADIGGANSATYTPVPGQEGSTLRVVETVSQDGYNDGSSTSDRATVVVGPITTNTAVAVTGTPTVGISSGITQGTYTPSPTGRSYQWKRCDNTGANCTKISGATSNTYTPVGGDAGSTLRVVETATKFGYSDASSTSAASPIVANGNFSTSIAVAVNGTPTVGTASTLTAGSYTPTPTGSSYQWRLCNSGGTGCADISGATNPTYTPVATDVGLTLRVVETVSATGYNNGTSTSAASMLVIKGSISMTTAVAINGTPTVGTPTAISAGVYSPTPVSRTYQWRLCDSGGGTCADISGANGNTYTPLSAQAGMTLRVVETATKAGYNNGTSTSSAVVVNGVFATTTAVAINGTPTVGTKSTTTGGTYTPTPTGRSYQWKRCDSSGNNCVTISGATYNTYTPVAADVGKKLRVVETVKKSLYANGSSTSAASPLVIKGTFVMATQVAVFGYPKHGVTSGITQGSYTPNPTSRTYKWMRCTSVSLSSCVIISGATAKTYKPVSADIGKRLRVVETVSAPGYNNLSVTSLASTAVT
jgi:autotransporter-associated beta strand protein